MWHSEFSNGYTAQSWPQSYREDNVTEITNILRPAGFSDYAIAAICGNMQVESYLNPGQFEHSYQTGSLTGGYGLVQWTPRTKFSDWAGADWNTNWNKQPQRIIYEEQNNLQWIATSAYPISFSRFKIEDGNTYDVAYLARAFFYNYERGTILGSRELYAFQWLSFIQNLPPAPTPSGNIPIWLLFKIKWENERK